LIANMMYSSDERHKATQSIHRLITRALQEKGMPVDEYFLVKGEKPELADSHVPTITSVRVARKKGIWRYLPHMLSGKIERLLVSRKVDVVVCDGLGVMRTLIPVMRHLERLSLLVVLHSLVKFKAEDLDFLQHYSDRIRLVAVSPSLARDVKAEYPSIREITSAVANSLSPDFQANLLDRGLARSILNLPKSGHLSVVLSRLTEKKDVSLVIQAFAKVVSENRYLVIMGDGPQRPALTRLVADLGMESHVIWLGWVNSASQYLRAFDLFVSASTAEGFGLSVLEAHAAGLPVVCSRLPAHEDALEHHAAFFDVGNIEGCVEHLSSVVNGDVVCDLKTRYEQFSLGYFGLVSELHP
jgi:glycosyltransferase involved in cell wall biosynthesis